MLSELMGKNHQRLQLGSVPSSTVVAGTQLGTSHSELASSLLYNATSNTGSSTGSQADTSTSLWAIE